MTGHFSNGSEPDLTSDATETTYLSSAAQVAGVSLDGVVTSAANGNAGITVTNGGFTANVSVVVELGVTMVALGLTPPIVTLRELGSTAQVAVRGRFSDNSQRDLTSDPATSYSVNPAIATVSASGLLQA